MNPGDKVRLIHGKEQGIVKKVLNNKVIEVEIEDGFIIPVLKSELVLISKDESKAFTKEELKLSSANTDHLTSSTGLYMSLVGTDSFLDLYIINNTDTELLFTYGEERDGKYKGVAQGIIETRSYESITHKTLENFENWGTLTFQLIQHKSGTTRLPAAYIKKLKLKASILPKSKQNTPLLHREGYLFQLDKDAEEIAPKEIISNIKTEPKQQPALQKPAKEIDLHIEKIISSHHSLSNGEILRIQLDTFEKQLDTAIASGMTEITFIHGTGNGTLRTELHKRLSKNKQIRFFKDAQKDRFGYGATLVQIAEIRH